MTPHDTESSDRTEGPERTEPAEHSQPLRMLLAAAAAVVILVVLHVLVTPTPHQRNYEFAPEMARSPAVESQSLASELPNGLSDLPLVAGVVIRGAHSFDYASTPQDALRAGRELKNPFAMDDADALARGQRVYGIHCTVCHGADGGGQGLGVQRGLLPPPSLGGAAAVGTADGTLFHLLTKGRGNMPALAARITPDDRWRALLHVRNLQEKGTR